MSEQTPGRSPFRPPDRTGDLLSLSRQQFHRIAYTEWGDPKSDRVVICVHGLSRHSRDFDGLAAVLADKGYRVYCPDLVGRGRSGRLANVDDYAIPQYVVDMTALVARTGARQVDWIGTSLGGLTGIVMAGMDNSPIRRLIINDIGPFLPWVALRRIGDYLRGAPKSFASAAAVTTYLSTVHAPFGPLSAEQWEHLASHSTVEKADGSFSLHYDPGIAEAFRPGRVYNVSLWNYWDMITCPTLVIRGSDSDLLLAETAVDMMVRGPKAEVVELAGVGHAPALLDPDQIELVTDWLERTDGEMGAAAGAG